MGMWDDEEEQFRDVPDETRLDENGQQRNAPNVQLPRQQAPKPVQQTFNGATNRFEEPVDQDDEDLLVVLEDPSLEEDFSEVLNDANLRIEQGRLYQMIMNHDLFEGMEADPRAVANVQREIRKFARESMEVMLGMRQTVPVRAEVSQFNSLEIDILKKLASKATNGATESPEANEIAQAVREVPKKKTLTPISGSTGLKKTLPVKNAVKNILAEPKKQLQTKPRAPVVRTKQDKIIEQIAAEEGISVADLELEYTGIGKKLHELTAEELSQRQKESLARLSRKKTVKSESALPMATPDEQAYLAAQRALGMQGAQTLDGLKIPGGMSALLEKVKGMPIKNPG